MSDLRTILERGVGGATPPPDGFERMLRRRDRKRRNQRIAAGVVGIAVFVTAVWIVTTGGAFDRSEKSVVPAGTGPVQTGPAETGPTAAPDTGWDGVTPGLPPEGTALSSPVEGQSILQQSYLGEWLLGKKIKQCPKGCGEWYNTFRIVYADGRVLWWNALRMGGGNYVLERRLTPEGVDLVRSGTDPDDLPNSAWADAEARPYAPPRYSICLWGNHEVPVPSAVDLLPAPAKVLLAENDPDPLHPGCLIVSTKEAHAFYEILWEEGLDRAPDVGGSMTPGDTVGSWLLPGAEAILGEQIGVYLRLLWPDGDWHQVSSA